MKPLPSIEDLIEISQKHHPGDAIVRGVLARVPPSWSLRGQSPGGAAFRRGDLQVLVSVSLYDGLPWVHASVVGRTGATRFHLPSWEAVKRVKHDFIGCDRWAYVVLPSDAEYVNQNPHCLHLFSRLEGEPALPDFTRGLGIL